LTSAVDAVLLVELAY